jgi:pimeloyl-ACP methyl ester carboxylesterase
MTYSTPFIPARTAILALALAVVIGLILNLETSPATATAIVSPGQAQKPIQEVSPLRDLWSRGRDRFIRQWLLLGPLPAGPTQPSQNGRPASEAEVSLHPTPNMVHVLPGGGQLRWTPFSSFQDVIELSGALGLPLRRPRPEAAYAYAVITRDHEGDALLSAGSDSSIQILVNGKVVHENRSPRAFMFDEDRIPVRLRQGDNYLLVKLEHQSGPWRFALRVLEPGTIIPRLDEIAPSIVGGTQGEVAVRTHGMQEPRGARVRVEMVAAGGRVVAQAEAQRGEIVRFGTRDWPDGAYEVRYTTQTAWGKNFTRHLSWYKGDALAAARRLLDVARSAPDRADGSTLRMLAEMVLDRLEGNLNDAPEDAWLKVHSPLLEFEELEQARSGGTGPVRPFGFVRLAYSDDIDGSPQYARAYLPPGYESSRRWPLVIFLHGYNPPNPVYVRWWGADQRHSATAENEGVIFLEPHGRGNSQYLWIGEQDVLRCLNEAKRRFSIDEDRVYLMGESMGGSGSWIIASRHPDLFAAAAPVFGGWDFRVSPNFTFVPNPKADSPPERFAAEIQSSFLGAEGLLNVPLFVNHGDDDRTVSVEYSRHAVRMLQRWGYDVRYEEYPGWGHEDLDARDRIVEWLLTHRRVTAPRRVRVRAADLGGASAYWVQVKSWDDPFRLIVVDAEVVRPGLVRLDSDNVAALTLSLPPELRGRDDALQVIWNGQTRRLVISSDGSASLSAPETPPGPLAKRPELLGRLSNILTTPFAVVVGTASKDPLMRQLCREKAEVFASLWNTWQHHPPRVFRDDEITSAEESRYSLLLIGGADANLVTRRFASRIPLQVESDAVTIDGRRLPASDAVVQMIYPSPARSDRYVLMVASTSTTGFYFWNPAAFWNQGLGFPTLFWDWTVRDGRRVKLDAGLGPERGWVAAGIFDRHWRRDDRWVFLGDPELRARSPLRRPPHPDFALPEGTLDAYAGQYELYPGYLVSIVRDGQRLKIAFPTVPSVYLIAESETEFSIGSTSAPLVFIRDRQGQVTGFVLNNDGQELLVRKVN